MSSPLFSFLLNDKRGIRGEATLKLIPLCRTAEIDGFEFVAAIERTFCNACHTIGNGDGGE